MKKMYLDDLRTPKTKDDWVIIRSTEEAIEYVLDFGMTSYASLDHDLGGEDTTMEFLKWLIDFDLANNGKIIPDDFQWGVHSANPVGEKNMDGLLTSYIQHKRTMCKKDTLKQ